MARVSKGPSYEASKRRYVANLDGEKIVLSAGVDKTKENDEVAQEGYDREKAVRRVQVTGDRSPVWAVLNAWLQWLHSQAVSSVSKNTFERRRRLIQSFVNAHGDVVCRDLRAWHIEDWLCRMREKRRHPVTKKEICWEEGMVKLALATLKQAFKWAEERDLVSTNPFRGGNAHALKVANYDYRGKRLAIERHEYEALLRLAVKRSDKDWAILLMLLWGTGARPSEMIMARAEEWDEGKRAFVIRHNDPTNEGRFKLRRLKRDRIIFVPDELVPFVHLLIEKYQGQKIGNVTPLFRKEKGSKKGETHSITSVNFRLDTSRKKSNREAAKEVIRKGLSGYSFRHAYVTRWLMAKKNVNVLAELIGTSPLMIQKHYSHLFQQHDMLRDEMNDFQQVRDVQRDVPKT
jgi:integrase